MRKRDLKKKAACLCLTAWLLLFAGCGGSEPEQEAQQTPGEAARPAAELAQVEKETAAAMIGELSADEEVGAGYEWSIIAIAASSLGDSPEAQAVYTRFQENLRLQVKRSEGVLSEERPTDNAKAAIALQKTGLDPADVEGYDLLKQLEDTKAVRAQGINAEIWALIAAASCGYDLEARQTYLDDLLQAQDEDGAVTYDGSTQDVDITAMAVQAMAPFAEGDEELAGAADAAAGWLGGMQQESGDYGNAESTAQVIIALSCMGEDPEKAEGFSKDGASLWDGLMLYRSGSGFSHERGGEINTMATEQGLSALDAIRLAGQEPGLYY